MRSAARRATLRTCVTLFALLALPLLLGACGGRRAAPPLPGDSSPAPVSPGTPGPTATVAAGAPVRVGVSSVLSGTLRALGVPLAQAAELAGRGATVDGHPVVFEAVDDACTAAGGAAAAQRLVAAGVVAVIGPVCPAAVAAAQPLYAAAGIPVLSPSSTAISSTNPVGHRPYPNFFRVTYDDAIQAAALARFATHTLHARTAYVVVANDLSDVRYGDAFAADFGGTIAGRASFPPGATTFSDAVDGARSSSPDVVAFFGYYAEAASFVRALRDAGVTAPLLAPDTVHDPSFLARAGAAAQGVYVSLPAPSPAGSAYDHFAAAYRSAYDSSPAAAPFTANAYDAATVVLNALRRVAQPHGDALTIDEHALRDAIARTDLAGASGRVRFDASGNDVGTQTPVHVLVVRNGAFQEVPQ